MAIVVDPNGPMTERWVVVAMKAGNWVPMFPKRIPLCGSQQEAIDRTMLLLGQDPVFAARWSGWTFLQVPLQGAIRHQAAAAA